MNKKSQGEIITTVLIILLVLAAVIIVWQVVSATISDSGNEPYYSNCQTFCEYYNMNCSTEDWNRYCYNMTSIDTLYKKSIDYKHARWYFIDG
jgi:hypothetical protein